MLTIIGNGESRKSINISKIDGIKIGCNAIYLYENVDYICAMDKFWRDKIIKESRIPLISRLHNTAIQTTLELYNVGWKNTTCPYRGYCSGITALDYASHYKLDKDIYLIGFDFAYNGDKVNHIYKNTEFHPNDNRPAQNENIFLNQCIEVIKRYPKINYYWVSNFDIKIKELNRISIIKYKDIVYDRNN